MASQEDLRDLLRLMTTGRNKVPMMAAMGRVKSLQAANIRSIADIAKSDLAQVTEAISDDKAAKQLHTAAKNSIKDPSKKRAALEGLVSTQAKRNKSAYELDYEPQTPEELEAKLELPTPSSDEEDIRKTTIVTNRAPLVLAFAVALLKFTKPEQPLSSRLSLAQAVVSANSRSKAGSIGITKGTSAEDDGWGQGQPKVRIMGREVHVLKRDGYYVGDSAGSNSNEESSAANNGIEIPGSDEGHDSTNAAPDERDNTTMDGSRWAVSQSVTLKKSTFNARAIGIKSASDARSLKQELISGTHIRNSELRDASHNITAWRVQGDHGGVIEDCHDDGESGGGRHILGILQSMDLVSILVVVTRCYGGIMLGTDRWKLMTQVCHDALSQRLRVAGTIGNEALWGLDLEAMRSTNSSGRSIGAGLPIHEPDGGRSYIMKAFAPSGDATTKKKTGVALEREKERNLGLLFGALELLFGSWVEHIGADELDKRAWLWYVQVRPEVESGAAGWGGKGEVKLSDILGLRRKG
ncbi:hypothetical protein VC83_00914 [Pseudogymnoascus destructans]|uniref:Impact N-terminal domain-containing protein n=2 Tax=Pseudogymnoascus destructans TaxID=655981 RepID=L8FPS5_PSED2|nr:uncharacterized protein VC83_00914 [Pseudogymnoascus destructans]ELR01686.1 hypothetical protein GMDG_00062 [Pseudogymnoascus destructans 20631-21]OAF62292.1 hypothetical protein VC83_00914 [Pseudogymnoascus destructans]